MKKLVIFDVDSTLAVSKTSLNDYPVKLAGVVSIQVRDPEESKRIIKVILVCMDGA